MTVTTAAKRAAQTVTSTKPKTVVIELDPSFAAAFDELSEVTLARKEAEDREKELKQLILSQLPPREKGVTLAVRVGTAIRAKVSMRSREVVSSKILKDAFPEAFQAASHVSEYDVVSPA